MHLWEKAKEMAKSVRKEEDGVGIEVMQLRHGMTSYTAVHRAAAILSGKSMFYDVHKVDVGSLANCRSCRFTKLAQSTNCWVLTTDILKA